MKWKKGRSKNRNVIDIRGAKKSGGGGGGGFGGLGGLGGGGGMPIPMGKGKIGGVIGMVSGILHANDELPPASIAAEQLAADSEEQVSNAPW